MPNTPNVLERMSDIVDSPDISVERPKASFLESALPGFKQALETRRSIRAYDTSAMPVAIMRDCLSDALLAPSSSNLQTYELYWVRDETRKAQLAEFCLAQPAATTAGQLVVVVARPDKWKANLEKLIGIMTKEGSQPLEGPLAEYYTSVVPMICRTDPLGINNLVRRVIFWFKGRKQPFMRTPVNRGDHRIYGHIQAALAAQTLMLSIAAHGYESCPIGGMDKKRIGSLLDLPAGAEVTMVIAAGRGLPEGLYGKRVRLPEDELIKEV